MFAERRRLLPIVAALQPSIHDLGAGRDVCIRVSEREHESEHGSQWTSYIARIAGRKYDPLSDSSDRTGARNICR